MKSHGVYQPFRNLWARRKAGHLTNQGRKNIKPQDLKEGTDVEEMKNLEHKIEVCRQMFLKKKEALLKMDATTDPKERIAAMETIQKTIILVQKSIVVAENFYNSKPKKEVEIDAK